MPLSLSKTDIDILKHLQADASISTGALAERLHPEHVSKHKPVRDCSATSGLLTFS